jgi:hypothetical protein
MHSRFILKLIVSITSFLSFWVSSSSSSGSGKNSSLRGFMKVSSSEDSVEIEIAGNSSSLGATVVDEVVVVVVDAEVVSVIMQIVNPLFKIFMLQNQSD